MGDPYAYPLLVEIEENSIPKLRNKLVKYFQSKKSHGGDCEVDYENGSRTAVLRFRREEDQKNVLGKEAHQISLERGVLKLTVRLPADEPEQEAPSAKISKKSDVAVSAEQSGTVESTPAAEAETEQKGGDDDSADEELCSTSAVLENIPEMMNQEFLEMLVENVLKDPDSPAVSQNFTLEVISGISSAVVTFQSGKENANFMMRCPRNRTFMKKGLSVRSLEPTSQVVVEDIKNFSEDLLRLYFENAGGDVENTVLNQLEQSVIITFKDCKAVQKVMQKKHHIKQEEIRVYPFYTSLGTALYGKDKPTLKLPAAISETIDKAVWKYIQGNQSAADTIHSHLAKHFCSINLHQSTVCLSPLSTVLQQKNAKTLVEEWRDTAKSAFAQALTVFRSLELQPEPKAWEESEEKVREMLLKEDVAVVPDKANGVILVAGLVSDVRRLEQMLCEVVNDIVKRVNRETMTVTQEIKVPPSIFHILCQDGLQDHLLCVYPELKLSFGKTSPDVLITGLKDEIIAARQVIYDAVLALKRQNLEMDKFVLDFLNDEQQDELTNALLLSNGVNAALEISAHRVQLIAVSERDLNGAEEHLKTLLISKYIDAEDSNVLVKPEWQQLVSQLENTNNKSGKRIKICTNDPRVVVSGHKDNVIQVSSKLEDFLRQNAQVEETVMVKPNAMVEYIKKIGTSWLERMEDKVVVTYRKEAISLSGSRADVKDCKVLIENIVSSLFFEIFKVSKPGVKKFFHDKEAMHVTSLLTETGCLVQLADEISGEEEDSSQVSKPMYRLQTTDGVEIAVCKADMCSYSVHAVVSASNEDLKLNGGLSAALLNAAGSQLQDECDKLISVNGQLKPGDCVITGAGGRLCCKKVIHAVGPRFDPAKPQKALAQLKRAVKGSLELAEQHGCISVALPAISRSLGFPLNLCAATIVKAVKEHCDDKYDDNTLKRIHFVNNEDSVVQAMEAAVRQEFGNSGVSPFQQTLPIKAIKPPAVKHAGSDPNCLGQVQTKEGLGITLTKGNIEVATTEVTVNTVFEDLNLNKGAVSNAIFAVAGARLQLLVSAKGSSGNIGEVIVTEGCNLTSKQVFHAVTPHWDKGQGTAEKTLRGIVKDCLDKAESSGLTSISFPAIGTGNLGFPKDIVASLMLDEILAFSSQKQPKHLKKVVIILYSGDAQTTKVFSDEFMKKFPSASGGMVPTSSTQRQGPFSKVVSGSGMHETKMGSVTIQVATGDITKETTDVIINSSNENFSLKSGVSKAILDAAGQAVETECQILGAQPNHGMIMTQPGNLKCKNILHLVGQTDPIKIRKAVKEALKMCAKKSHTSVAFPAIGTGQGNVQASQVADAMLDAVIEVLSQNTSSTLKTIRIVIFQPPMLKEFYNSLQQREAPDPTDKGTFWGSIGTKIKSLFSSERADKPQTEGDFVIEPLEVDPVCFHICGKSQAEVDSAKQRINHLISKEHNKSCITDNTILSFSDADHKCIADIQKTLSVSIRTVSKNGQASITIEGLSKDVLKATNDIHELLKKARDQEDLIKKVELASTVADWQYLQQGLQFQSFDAKINFELEQALEKKLPNIKVKIHGQEYTVTMPNGPATDKQGCTLQIKRIDKLKDNDVPDNWIAMPTGASSQAVAINPGTAEYTEVQNLFKATCQQNIIKIERIQNLGLWKSLRIKKRDMEQRNGHQNNEKRLFHGTCHTTVAHINNYGFNRSYAGKNAACYGRGTYFAVNASYSASNTYSRPNQTGEKCMYLCRVLTGDYTTGNQSMIVPPAKSNNSIQIYDSVVDNMANPSMFVIFHDSQAYPEYLITFK